MAQEKSKLNEAKKKAVQLAMEQIEKQYGRGSIMRLGQKIVGQVKSIPTGCLPLDLALGVGGIPRGRVTEIFGPEASGKTTVCLHLIAEVQKQGGVAAFIDAEHALYPERAKLIGVNLDDLIVSQPDTGEQALEIVETLVRSGGIDLIVIDSVAALVPRAEIEGEMGDAMMGVQARLMSQALRKLTGAIAKTDTAVVFTNQIRKKIGVFFGKTETTPGGLALKFYSSVRIDLRKTGNIKDNKGVVIGSTHRARVVKNKVAPPFREAEFEIMNREGISRLGGVIDLGLQYGILSKSGAFIRYQEITIGQGREAAKQWLRDHPQINAKIEAAIRQKAVSS